MGADGSRVSAVVTLLCYISGGRITILLLFLTSTLIYKLGFGLPGRTEQHSPTSPSPARYLPYYDSMKFQALFISTIVFFQVGYSQTTDTIRIYDHLKPTDRWKLKINNQKFTLYTNRLFSKDDIVSTGKCNVKGTTIHFICDTSKLKNKNWAKHEVRQFSNIPFILNGDTFERRYNFFIPYNLNRSKDSLKIPAGIFARYYRGDGLGSNIVELKEDRTYIFYDNSCTMRFTEKGTWSLDNDIITFNPDEGKWSMLEWVTKDRKLYLTDNYLIGKKTTRVLTKTGKKIVTETYSYLSKQPNYPGK